MKLMIIQLVTMEDQICSNPVANIPRLIQKNSSKIYFTYNLYSYPDHKPSKFSKSTQPVVDYRKFSLADTRLNKIRMSIDSSKEISMPEKTKHISKKNLSRVTVLHKQNSLLKTKSDFQRKLMSDDNIAKYKQQCNLMIKEDLELKSLMTRCETSVSYETFLENKLFSDNVFVYKLEMMLKTESIKANRDKFFKKEIKKVLNLLHIENEYNKKVESLNGKISQHIERISKFELLN